VYGISQLFTYPISQEAIAFMAMEVAHGYYNFTTTTEAGAGLEQLFRRTRVRALPFVYNPLYDSESLWWILLWILSYKTPSTVADEGERDTIWEHHSNSLKASPQRLEEGTRDWIILGSSFFEFFERYKRNLFLSMIPYLAHVRTSKKLLVESYTVAEATYLMDGKINGAAYSATHQQVIQQIDQVLVDPRCKALTLYALSILFQVNQEDTASECYGHDNLDSWC
jgi:hypothetical protein